MLLAEVGEQHRQTPPRDAPPGGASIEDAALVQRFQRGDASAFDAIVARHRPRVAQLAHRLLGWGGGADVDDVVQDVFLAAYEKLHAFRGASTLSTWLTAVTLNRCRRHRRGWLARLTRLKRRAEHVPVPDSADAADHPAERDDLLRQVREAVRALPQKDGEVVVLYYLEQHSVAEICELLGATKGAVEVRLHRARQRLKGLLAALGEE